MLETGSLLNNRYQLQRQLSNHLVRQTWLAEDLDTQQLVVVKLLAFGGPMQWEDLKLFEREAQVLEQLDHAQIPQYRDDFSVDERSLWFALVQEFIPGSSLKQLLKGGKQFSEADVVKIARSVLEILTYLHQLRPQVLHRDIKPSNLLWGEDDRIYLVDFGAVQNRSVAPGGTFTVVGTYGYTPLEQFGGQAVPASDLYALGMTLIHLLTGAAPAELPQQDMRIQWRDRVNSSISKSLVAWIDRLSEPAIERRFKSAIEAIEALEASQKAGSGGERNLPQRLSTGVQMYKSRDRLAIEIPSQLELNVLHPLGNAIKTIGSTIFHPIVQFVEGFKALQPHVQATVAIATVTLLMAIGRFFPYALVSLSQMVTRILFLFISLVLSSVPFLIPFVLIIGLFLAIRGGDYLERTSVYFDLETFEIERQYWGSSSYEKNHGSTLQIKDISVEKYQYNNRICNGIVITARPKWAIFARSKKYVFGQQLREEELMELAREIGEWLELK